MTTQPTRTNVVRGGWPSFIRSRRRKVAVPDGQLEIDAIDICYNALLPLSNTAQERVVHQVVSMLNERSRMLSEYDFEE